MNEYIEKINKLLTVVSNQIKSESDKLAKEAKSKEEAEKIKYISVYYRTILQGTRTFSSVVLEKINKIDEAVMFVEQANKPNLYENGVDDTTEEDVVLNDNPPINVEVEEVYNQEDVVMETNPNIKTQVSDVSVANDDNDDIFDKILNVEVSEVSAPFEIDPTAIDKIKASFDERRKKMKAKSPKKEEVNESDLVLEENPDLKLEIAEVVDINDIVLDENPPINVEISEVYNQEDVVLDENPKLDVEVTDVIDNDLTEKQDVE